MNTNQISYGAFFTTVHPDGHKDSFFMRGAAPLPTPEEVKQKWPRQASVVVTDQWQADTIGCISDWDQRLRNGSHEPETLKRMMTDATVHLTALNDSPFWVAEIINGEKQLVSMDNVTKDEWLAIVDESGLMKGEL